MCNFVLLLALVACCLLSHLGTGLPVFEVQDFLTEEDRQRHANIPTIFASICCLPQFADLLENANSRFERLVMRGVCSDSFSCSLLHDGKKSKPLVFFIGHRHIMAHQCTTAQKELKVRSHWPHWYSVVRIPNLWFPLLHTGTLLMGQGLTDNDDKGQPISPRKAAKMFKDHDEPELI